MKRLSPAAPLLAALALVLALTGSSCAVVRPEAFSVNKTYTVSNSDFLTAVGAVAQSKTLRDFLAQGVDPKSSTEGATGETYDMAFVNRVLDAWVRQKILVDAAAAKGITASDADRQQVRSQLEQALNQETEGRSAETTIAELGGFLDVIIDYQVIQSRLGELVSVDDAAVRAAYDENPAEFEQVCVSAIVISVVPPPAAGQQPAATAAPTPQQTEAATAKARDLAAQARTGDFAALARANSEDPQSAPQGGSLGCVQPASLEQQYPQLQGVAAGTVVDPFPVQGGQYLAIFRIDSRGSQSFEEARAAIEQGLQQQGQRQALLDVFQSATVVVNPRYGSWNPKEIEVTPPPGPSTPSVPTSSVPGVVFGQPSAGPGATP